MHVVSSTSAEVTIKKLTEIFAINGVTEQLVSDNRTRSSSHESALFTKKHGIHHTFVSPITWRPMDLLKGSPKR